MKCAVRFRNIKIRRVFGVVWTLPPLKYFQRFLVALPLLVSIIWSIFERFFSFREVFSFQKVGGAGGGMIHA